jgi:hypothetical protein
MPRYNPDPAADFYVPAEDEVLDEVMDRVLVRYGRDPRRLRAVLNRLYTAMPAAFRRVVQRRAARQL